MQCHSMLQEKQTCIFLTSSSSSNKYIHPFLQFRRSSLGNRISCVKTSECISNSIHNQLDIYIRCMYESCQSNIPEHSKPEHETFQSRTRIHARAQKDERVNESFTQVFQQLHAFLKTYRHGYPVVGMKEERNWFSCSTLA